jgi:hypothetical protein
MIRLEREWAFSQKEQGSDVGLFLVLVLAKRYSPAKNKGRGCLAPA